MNFYGNSKYMEDIHFVADLPIFWDKLEGNNIFISGSTGMIGSFLIDVILEKNINDGLNCMVYALGRNKEKAMIRFCKFENDSHFKFIPYDVRYPFTYSKNDVANYIIHLASNTHPLLYSTDPIGTIITNIVGVHNLLDFAVEHHATRFAFASSNEIYGENRGDVEYFDEKYCGYIDSNTLRAGYPESKRCGEALCQAYMKQTGLDVVIPRFTRTYGPTMNMSDTKAISQFIINCINGKNIILKSTGTQFYSYQYVADSVSGLLTIILNGESGEAYNISDKSSDILLKDLAMLIASIDGKEVVYELPSTVEAAGYSMATKARLCGSKLHSLGWKPKYNIESGLRRTIEILKEIYK